MLLDSGLEPALRVWVSVLHLSSDVQLVNAVDQFPRGGTELLDGAEGRCVLWDRGI